MSFEDDVRATFRRGDSEGVLRMARAEVERARAEQLAGEALDVAMRSGDRRLEERPRHVLAAVTRMSGDYVRARELYLASIALNEELGQPEMVNSEYHNLAFTELHLGNLDRAPELFEQGRERVFLRGYHSFVPYLGVAAAALATAEGDHLLAARMIGFTDSAYTTIRQVPDPDDAEELSNARATAIAVLGDARFAEAYEAGAALEDIEAFGLTWRG